MGRFSLEVNIVLKRAKALLIEHVLYYEDNFREFDEKHITIHIKYSYKTLKQKNTNLK